MLSVHFERRPAVYQAGHGRNVWSLLFEPSRHGQRCANSSTPTKNTPRGRRRIRRRRRRKAYKVHLLFFFSFPFFLFRAPKKSFFFWLRYWGSDLFIRGCIVSLALDSFSPFPRGKGGEMLPNGITNLLQPGPLLRPRCLAAPSMNVFQTVSVVW